MKKQAIIMKKIISMMMVLLLVGISAAETDVLDEMEKMMEEMEEQEIPPPLGTVFGNEKINIHFSLDDGGTEVLGLLTENKKIRSVDEKELANPSLNVYLSEEVLKDIYNSDNPSKAFKKALDEKKITYKAVGIFNKLKFGVVLIFAKIASYFGGEEDEVEEEEEVVEEDEVEEEEEVVKEDEVVVEEEEMVEEDEVEDEMTGATIKDTEENKPESHIVQLTDDGFEVEEITIKVGEKIIWQNAREGKVNKAMIIGVQGCAQIRSDIFPPGEYFSWTFEEPRTCVFVGGVYTTQTMKVVVEE